MNIFSLIKLTKIKKSRCSPKTTLTINLGSIINVEATHIRGVANIYYRLFVKCGATHIKSS